MATAAAATLMTTAAVTLLLLSVEMVVENRAAVFRVGARPTVVPRGLILRLADSAA